MKNKTFNIVTLGCKVNSYECGSLKSALIKEGFSYAPLDENIDIIIINTCSVTSVADKKSRQHIRSLKIKYPNAKICVMGCYSQKNHDFIFDDIKVDIVTGCSNRKAIIDCLKNNETIDMTETNTQNFLYEEISSASYFDNVRAYLKIQDGCDNYCSYCLIPYLRGKMRSRNKDDVINEAKYLVKNSYKEIILTGIHVGGYGKDINDYSFSDLIEELSNINGLERITISSIEASEIDDKFIELIKTKSNIAKHLHIPLQSGSETVLQRMNRKYTKKEFLDKINRLRKSVDDLFIATDVIVGFPGETEEEFLETYKFIEQAKFDKLHVFPFSPREGTKAYHMDNQIDAKTKKERVKKLLNLSDQLYSDFTSRYIDKDVNVLVETFNEKTKLCFGHSENFLEVSFPGTEKDINQIRKVKYNKN